MAAWRSEIAAVKAGLAAASTRAGVATATVGAAMIDSESFGWCHRYHNAAEIKAAVKRKNELVYNTTRSVLGKVDWIVYSYGEPWWMPYNIKGTCCTNIDPQIPVPGWCTEKHGTFTEVFSREVPLTASLYEVYQPEFTRQKFKYLVQNAIALNGSGTVMPYVALGSGFRRNYTGADSMLGQAPPRYEGGDVPFFNIIFGSYDYDRSFDMLLGAQLNLPQFNSSGAWAAFGPWERARGAVLFPSSLTRLTLGLST